MLKSAVFNNYKGYWHNVADSCSTHNTMRHSGFNGFIILRGRYKQQINTDWCSDSGQLHCSVFPQAFTSSIVLSLLNTVILCSWNSLDVLPNLQSKSQLSLMLSLLLGRLILHQWWKKYHLTRAELSLRTSVSAQSIEWVQIPLLRKRGKKWCACMR